MINLNYVKIILTFLLTIIFLYFKQNKQNKQIIKQDFINYII